MLTRSHTEALVHFLSRIDGAVADLREFQSMEPPDEENPHWSEVDHRHLLELAPHLEWLCNQLIGHIEPVIPSGRPTSRKNQASL